MQLCSTRRHSATKLMIVLALAAAACGGESDSDTSAEENAPTDEASGTEDETLEEQQLWVGDTIEEIELRVGQCYNEELAELIEGEDPVEVTAPVDCSQAHDFEVFHEVEHPARNGTPYPGDDAMNAWSTRVCYEAFEPFVGTSYERSALEIKFSHPIQENFEHPTARFRRVSCHLYAPGERLTGTANQTNQ